MIGWLAYLIYTGKVRYIVLSFLPVGHTHEDIDQVFSRLSVYLSSHDALNMEQLHEAVRGAYQTKEGSRAKCSFWDRCANFSEWIGPYLNLFTGITQFRQFRFYKVDDVVRVQAREHTSQQQEWAGIRGQDAWTPVFRTPPPMEMEEVPPTQRRDILADALVEKQKASILKLAGQRHINPTVLESVLDGIDLLGDEDDLEFDWDLDSFMNRDEDAPVVVAEDEDNQLLGDFAYKYDPGQYVLIQPLPGAEAEFWLGRLEAAGGPDRRGEYEVWWMSAFNDSRPYDTTWNLERHNGQPFLDWQFEEGVQDAVVMISNGKKISARSKKTIRSFVARWQQAGGQGDDANAQFAVIDGDDDMEIPANEAGMD
jgi:hypothetical protein